jgi:hypothetical protein
MFKTGYSGVKSYWRTEGKAGIEVHLSPGDESGARFATWKVDFHDIECWRRQVEGIEAELEKRR